MIKMIKVIEQKRKKGRKQKENLITEVEKYKIRNVDKQKGRKIEK